MSNRASKIAARRWARSSAPTGRPRSEGPRQPSGRLKPPEPNAVVIAHRRLLLGKPEARGQALRSAENALDLMLARGWLPQSMHRAGRSFQRLYAMTFPRLPDLRVGAIDEAPACDDYPVDRLTRSLVRVSIDGDPAAMGTLRTIWRVLDHRVGTQSSLIEALLLPGAWPSWLVAMVQGRGLSVVETTRRAAFFMGLHLVDQVMRHPAVKAA